MLCHPGAKETGESHAGLGAFGTPCAPTDFASHDQGANAALGQIVVGWNPRHRDKDKEFGQNALNAFTLGMLRGRGPHGGAADRKQLLFEDMLLRHASLLLLAW
jgi:hypothetical protein